MKRDTLILTSALVLALPGALPLTRAVAQSAPAAASASAPTPAPAPAAVVPPAQASDDATAGKSDAASKGRGRKTVGQGMNAQTEAGEPRVDTSAAGANTGGPATAAGAAKTAKTPDRVDLDTTTVTGNRELPKVMYVVPWKKSDIGDLGGKPMNSLLDEVLAPVDRDVFRREVVYYQAVNSKAVQSGAADAASPAAGAKQVEK
jgi:hypothetical protein